MQIGRIKGGIARNVIADQCTVDWELRPVVFEDGVFEDGVFVNIKLWTIGMLKQYILLPEMKKTYSGLN